MVAPNSPAVGVWYVDPSTLTAVPVPRSVCPLEGMAYLALRDIAPGEELYFDYRLAAATQPAWYSPADSGVVWRAVDAAEREQRARSGAAGVGSRRDEQSLI